MGDMIRAMELQGGPSTWNVDNFGAHQYFSEILSDSYHIENIIGNHLHYFFQENYLFYFKFVRSYWPRLVLFLVKNKIVKS